MTAATCLTNCLPRETLKQYLVGDVEEAQTEAIESHLASCPACELTVVELEANPDTLLVGIRAIVENPVSSNDSNVSEEPSVVKHALAAVRRLPESTNRNASEWPVGQIGAYELLRPLGRGGMGMVILARHRNLQKEVAIKLLSSLVGDKPELVSRFQREMRAAGRLQHPAIVNATDAGQERGTHYLVMEYVAGLDLSRIARLVGRLSIADACELMRQTALGLSHAHAEGIVHRDVKPSNLMLDASGHVKILDFGLAQINLWDEPVCELTTVGQLMGTIDYMAPEQAERIGAVDYRADLYALGATLFRLIAGRAPLAASPNMTLLEKVRLLGSQTSPLLSTVREDCPPELVQLVSQLLSRDPAARPASAAHVAQALEPFGSGSQLVELLATAQAAAAAAPVADPETPLPSLAHPSSLQYADTVDSSNTPTKPPTGRWLWTAAAALPFMILAGIFITIETQKGQLVIQSDVADVQIKVARDGKVVDELTIHPGAQSTRLRADKYEILIDSPSDQVVLDKQQFFIKSGETVVATIKQVERGQAAMPSAESTLPSNSEELTYDGTSYSQWLRKLATDVSYEKQLESLKALYSIGERQQIEDARPVILRVLKDMAHRRVTNAEFYGSAFGVLGKTFASQEMYVQFLASEAKNGNEEWQTFILGSHGRFLSEVPLIDVAKELVLQADAGRPKTVEAAGDYLFDCARAFAGSGNDASVLPLLDALERSPSLTMSFWVKNLFGESDRAFTEMIRGTVARVTSRALTNKISPEEGMRALLLIDRYGDPANMDWLVPYASQLVDNPERISRFYQLNGDTLARALIVKTNRDNSVVLVPHGEAIDVLRLVARSDLNSEKLAVIRRLLGATMNVLPNAKEWLKLDEGNRFGQTQFNFFVRSENAWNQLTETQRGLIVVGTAATSLLPDTENDVDLRIEFLDSLQVGKRAKAEIIIRNNSKVSLPRVDIVIDNDAALRLIRVDGTNSPRIRAEDRRLMWSTELEGRGSVRKLVVEYEAATPSNEAKIEMMALLGDKSLGEATRSTSIAASQSDTSVDLAEAPLSKPKENLAEPFFDGRTLSQWFEILERDRDEKARATAMKAIDSLASKAESSKITERLLALARQAKADEWSDYEWAVSHAKFGGRGQYSPTLDSSLIDLLIHLNGKEWFRNFLITDLLVGDDIWTARWLAALLQNQNASQSTNAASTIFERFKSTEAYRSLGPNSAWLAEAWLIQFLTTLETPIQPVQDKASEERLLEAKARVIAKYVDSDKDVKAWREKVDAGEADMRAIERKEQTGLFANRYRLLRKDLEVWKMELAKAESEAHTKAVLSLVEDMDKQNEADKQRNDMVEHVIKLIEKQPHLGKQVVLQIDAEIDTRFSGWNRNSSVSRSQLMVEEAIAKYAKAVLENDESSPEAIARAASRLASTTEIVDGWKPELLKVICKRFTSLAADHTRLVTTLPIEGNLSRPSSQMFATVKLPIPVTNRFVDIPAAQLQNQRNALEQMAMRQFRQPGLVPPYIESECMALIALMIRLNGASECEKELKSIAEKTQPDFDALTTQSGAKELRAPAMLWPYRINTAGEPWTKISAETWHGWAIHRTLFEFFVKEQQKLPLLNEVLSRTAGKLSFTQGDSNSDGKLSSDELSQQELSEGDSNKDGSLDFEEYTALLKLIQDRIASESLKAIKPNLNATEPTPELLEWAKRQVSKYDTNGDGKLSSEERQHILVDLVGADTDGDDEVTVEEYAKFRTFKLP